MNLKELAEKIKKQLQNSRVGVGGSNIPGVAQRTADVNRNVVQRGVQNVRTAIQNDPNQFNIFASMARGSALPVRGITPLDNASRFVGNYVQNRYVQPVVDLPKNLSNTFGPNRTLAQRGAGALGTLGGIATAFPDPIQDVGMPLVDLFKGVGRGVTQKLGKRGTKESAMKALTLEDPAGLGDALTTNPLLRTVGNFAELPLALLAGKVSAKNVDDKTRAITQAFKEGKITEKEARLAISKLNQSPQIPAKSNPLPYSEVGVPPQAQKGKKKTVGEGISFVDEMNALNQNIPVSATKPKTKVSEITKQEGDVKLTEAMIGQEDNAFKEIFNRMIGKREAAGTTGAVTGMNYRSIPKEKAMEFINHAEGVSPSRDPEIVARATQWKQETDALYQDLRNVASKEGVDLGYIDDYVTHFWKESPAEVQKMMNIKGRNFGSRTVPTYKEGIELGLTPKYENPAEIMSEYVAKIERTKANIGMFKEMKQRGLIVPASLGRKTPGFEPVNAPGFPRSTTAYEGKVFDGSYYAPSTIARQINKMFSPEDTGRVGKTFSIGAKLSKGIQDFVLSGGIPGTPINAFTAAQITKEFTSGSFIRPFKALAQSILPNKALDYFAQNAGQIKKMQERNVGVRSVLETESLMGGGGTWDRIVSTPTFKRFMPMLQVEMFNNIEKKALGMGKNATEAADIAAKAVKNFYGLADTGEMAGRSQLGQDMLSTFAFAPTYRESMINFWVNSLKSLTNPLALENRQNLKFLAGAAATYGAMNHLNIMLNGHPMSQNPKGKEDKLLIPAGDTTIGVPFLSSIATIPRGIYRIAKSALNMDFKEAGADTLRTFGSMLIKPVGEMILNEDYFGQEIVDPNATPIEKGKQIASYLFKSNTHPWLKAALEARNVPLYQTLSKAAELPFRFYKTSSIANAPFWENYNEVKALDEQFQELRYKDPDRAVEFFNQNKDKLNSLQSLKDTIGAYYDTGKDDSLLQGAVAQGDGHIAFKGVDGKVHVIDTDFNVPVPEFTGNELLDKKIKSSYSSKLTAVEKNITTLFENGIITADQAEEALGGVAELKNSIKSKKGKKPKKISIKRTTFKIPKLSKPKKFKPTTFKIVAPPKVKITTPKQKTISTKISVGKNKYQAIKIKPFKNTLINGTKLV